MIASESSRHLHPEVQPKGLLCPFHYFGLHDGTDLSRIEWRRNGYATEALSNLYTADDARLRLILRELADKSPPGSMRALGFCVSVEHAHWMARKFVAAGLRAAALDASSPRDERAEQIRRLRAGELQILFAVDLFNEGLDIPEIDTVLFLRPTESHLVFLQQLRPGPPQLPLRPALPRPARRHARPAETADRSGLSLPAGRLQPPARSRLQRAGAGEPARVAAQPPAPAARRSPPPRPLFPGGPARRARHGAGGVLPGGGVVGAAAAGAGLGGRGGLGWAHGG